MKSNKLKKIIVIAIVGMLVSAISPISASGTWLKDSQNNWNWTENGNKTTGWKQVDGTWYHFDVNGIMQTGWVRTADSKWYYMNADGGMKTGWLKDTDGKWYFTDISGAMQTGVIEVQGKVYVLEASGAMATGSTVILGKTYTIDESGAIAGDKPPTPEKVFTNEGTVTALYANSNLGTATDAITTDMAGVSTDITSSAGNSSSGGSGRSSSTSIDNSKSSSPSSITTNSPSSITSSSSSSSTSNSSTTTTTETSTATGTTGNSTDEGTLTDVGNIGTTQAEKVKKAIATIKNVANVIEMEKAITDNAEILSLNLTDYNGLKDKTSVQKALIGKDFSANTGSNADTSLFFEKLNIRLAFDDEVYSQRIAETDPNAIGGIISMQGSGLGYTKATAEAIATINNATDITAMEKAITDKAGILSLDLTDYEALKDKTKVEKALIGKLSSGLADGISSSTPYKFINDFRSKVQQDFAEAVLDQKTAEEAVTKVVVVEGKNINSSTGNSSSSSSADATGGSISMGPSNTGNTYPSNGSSSSSADATDRSIPMEPSNKENTYTSNGSSSSSADATGGSISMGLSNAGNTYPSNGSSSSSIDATGGSISMGPSNAGNTYPSNGSSNSSADATGGSISMGPSNPGNTYPSNSSSSSSVDATVTNGASVN